jgi:hypothetical protein
MNARKQVRNEGSQRFKSAPLGHPVIQFSDISENCSKSARVRAICDRAWTQRTGSGGADSGNTAEPIRARFYWVHGCSLRVRIHRSKPT